jgi:hypothetical protein
MSFSLYLKRRCNIMIARDSEITGSSFQADRMTGIGNLGYLDRAVRGVVALALIAQLFAGDGPVSLAQVLTAFAGMLVGFTSAVGWDPLYRLRSRPARAADHNPHAQTDAHGTAATVERHAAANEEDARPRRSA